jgi:hypothetical protein
MPAFIKTPCLAKIESDRQELRSAGPVHDGHSVSRMLSLASERSNVASAHPDASHSGFLCPANIGKIGGRSAWGWLCAFAACRPAPLVWTGH